MFKLVCVVENERQEMFFTANEARTAVQVARDLQQNGVEDVKLIDMCHGKSKVEVPVLAVAGPDRFWTARQVGTALITDVPCSLVNLQKLPKKRKLPIVRKITLPKGRQLVK